jgi:predicted nucleic acid-binding protein
VRLFLDTSVLLAATGSAHGASREIIRRAAPNGWTLLTTPYVLEEAARNLPLLASDAQAAWSTIRRALTSVPDVFTVNLPVVFDNAKDRPILFSAFASSDALLTLDRADFSDLLGAEFYGMPILKPGAFSERERIAKRLL